TNNLFALVLVTVSNGQLADCQNFSHYDGIERKADFSFCHS
ncbi:MAG: hypothetical protein ACJAS1_007502, partial [Oleiphilaceae bacterium]